MVKETGVIEWEAQEYVQHERNQGWYVGLAAAVIVLVGASIWWQWWTFLALVIVATVALVVYVARPPRVLKYKLDGKVLLEGEREYKLEDYKAFGLLNDNGYFAIVLTPRKRLAPQVTVFFPEEQGEQIVDQFGARLPMEEVKADFLDQIVRWLRI